MKNIVLDTNIILKISSHENPLGFLKTIVSFPEDCVFFTSAVTEAEIKAFVQRNQWGERRRADMAALLAEFRVIRTLGPELTDCFAEVKLFSQNRHPYINPDKGQGFKPGENDMWIAATTLFLEGILLTADKDFLPYHDKLFTVAYLPSKLFKKSNTIHTLNKK